MRTDTPLFRSALSVAVMWLIAWSYLNYRSYQADYRNDYNTEFISDESITEHCYNRQLDFDDSTPVWSEPPAEERTQCVNLAFAAHRKRVDEDNERLIWRSGEAFLKVALLPAATLLLVVAFWAELQSVGVLVVKRYAKWLRYGSKDAD